MARWWRRRPRQPEKDSTPERAVVGSWDYAVPAVRVTKEQGRRPYTVVRYNVNVHEPGWFMEFHEWESTAEWLTKLGWDGSPPTKTFSEVR